MTVNALPPLKVLVPLMTIDAAVVEYASKSGWPEKTTGLATVRVVPSP